MKESAPTKIRQRGSKACVNCHMRKVKCDGQLPCSTCLTHREICRYLPGKKRGPKPKNPVPTITIAATSLAQNNGLNSAGSVTTMVNSLSLHPSFEQSLIQFYYERLHPVYPFFPTNINLKGVFKNGLMLYALHVAIDAKVWPNLNLSPRLRDDMYRRLIYQLNYLQNSTDPEQFLMIIKTWCILTLVSIARGSLPSAWTHSRIALRLAIAHRLYLCDHITPEQQHLSDSTREAHRNAWWMCVLLDRIMCAVLQRPFAVPLDRYPVRLPESSIDIITLVYDNAVEVKALSPFTHTILMNFAYSELCWLLWQAQICGLNRQSWHWASRISRFLGTLSVKETLSKRVMMKSLDFTLSWWSHVSHRVREDWDSLLNQLLLFESRPSSRTDKVDPMDDPIIYSTLFHWSKFTVSVFQFNQEQYLQRLSRTLFAGNAHREFLDYVLEKAHTHTPAPLGSQKFNGLFRTMEQIQPKERSAVTAPVSAAPMSATPLSASPALMSSSSSKVHNLPSLAYVVQSPKFSNYPSKNNNNISPLIPISASPSGPSFGTTFTSLNQPPSASTLNSASSIGAPSLALSTITSFHNGSSTSLGTTHSESCPNQGSALSTPVVPPQHNNSIPSPYLNGAPLLISLKKPPSAQLNHNRRPSLHTPILAPPPQPQPHQSFSATGMGPSAASPAIQRPLAPECKVPKTSVTMIKYMAPEFYYQFHVAGSESEQPVVSPSTAASRKSEMVV